jgi:hypothetical protein
MPLKPDLGGFGESHLRYIGHFGQTIGAETNPFSWQNQSVWSKFPSWILQDALLGCWRRDGRRGQGNRYTYEGVDTACGIPMHLWLSLGFILIVYAIMLDLHSDLCPS